MDSLTKLWLTAIIGPLLVALISAIPGILALRSQERKGQAEANRAKSERDEIEDRITERVLERANRHINELEREVADLKAWRDDVVGFMVPFIEGSKLNEQELIKNGIDPPYKLPKLPRWINGEIN